MLYSVAPYFTTLYYTNAEQVLTSVLAYCYLFSCIAPCHKTMLKCTAPRWAILLSRNFWRIQMYRHLLHVSLYCHPILLWILYAVIWLYCNHRGSCWVLVHIWYGCTLTHSACWRIPVHPQQLLVYGDAPRAPQGHYTYHFCHIMLHPTLLHFTIS